MLAVVLSVFSAIPAVANTAAENAPVLDLGLVKDPEAAAALRSTYASPFHLTAGKDAEAKLDFWVMSEQRRLRSLLVSLGYLSAQVALEVSDSSTTVLKPITGQQYHIGSIELNGVRHAGLGGQNVSDIAAVLPSFTGQVASGDTVRKIADEVVYRMRTRTYALARAVRSQVVPDHSMRLAHIIIELDAGPAAVFGDVAFHGLHRVREASLSTIVPFRAGQVFTREKLELFETNLRALGKFSRVRVEAAETLDGKGRLAISVSLTEDPVDVRELTRSGMPGAALAGVALIVVGLRQFGARVGEQARFARFMTGLAWIVVPAFLAAAVLRVFGFLEAA